MRSACSERRGGRQAAAALLSALVLMESLLQPAGARGAAGWLRGVFPVASFAGYTSPFGMRTHPLSGDSRQHYGIDIAGPLGSPVRSWWHGTVIEVIRDGGCGNGLTIRSGNYEHVYCHLAGAVEDGWYRSGAVLLRAGQRVRAGQVIGHIGLTGSTTGPHLHWGIRYRGDWMDPARVLRAMAASRRAVATPGGSATPSRRGTPNVGVLR
ncbi:MAG: M23 family metallopeptidase [Synechococcaceae cyanobacterium]|nr:M23 family metallopeptidase [Synechococcaceae cyanobacterium]